MGARLPLLLSSLFFAALVPVPRADVLVVDESGGGDFLELQPAVQAAAEGDTILVRSGTYAGVEIVGKSLHLTEDAGHDARIAGAFENVEISDLGPAQLVTVRGLRLPDYGGPVNAFQILNCSGPVFLIDCSSTGAVPGSEADGVFVASSNVTLVRCTVRGSDVLGGLPNLQGGRGLRAVSSTVAVYDSLFEGGKGVDDFGVFFDGGPGGHGVQLTQSTLFGSGSTFRGGPGGQDEGDGEVGGVGLWIGVLSEANLVETATEGGPGGSGAGGVVGADGADVFLEPGAVPGVLDELPALARTFAVTSPVREGRIATLEATGAAGELLFAAYATSASPIYVEAFLGTLVAVPLASLPLGAVPAGGEVSVPAAVGNLPPGVSSFALYLQGVFFSSPGVAQLATPEVLVVLDAAF